MSARNSIQLDEIYQNELKMYEEEHGIICAMQEDNIKAFLEAFDRGMIIELIKRLCKAQYTGIFETDIVKAAFYANKLAHSGKYEFYSVKSKLLQYIFENRIWGEEPYDSFGIGTDEFYHPVAYFDVPECGQVSFHLVGTNYNEDEVPEYEMEWCKTVNYNFPTYKSIDNLHDLILALGYTNHEDLGEAVEAIAPIDFTTLDYHARTVSYFVGLNEFYDELFNNYEDETIYYNHLLNTIILRKIEFSKEHLIEYDEYIWDNHEKIRILRRCKDPKVQQLLDELDQER